MGLCYLPDGTTEMIFDVYGAWKVVEEKCGSDIVSEIKNSIEEETADREIDTFEMVGDVGKLFKKITTQLEKIDSDLNDAQNRLDVVDRL